MLHSHSPPTVSAADDRPMTQPPGSNAPVAKKYPALVRIPANAASGHNTGVIAQLHFYLDDIFPNTLGKPIFGGRL